jgi:hypothetical protein
MLSIQEQGIIYQMEFLHTNEQHKMYLLVTFYKLSIMVCDLNLVSSLCRTDASVHFSVSDVELVCRLVVYAIDTSNSDNMTIERYGRLPLERGNWQIFFTMCVLYLVWSLSSQTITPCHITSCLTSPRLTTAFSRPSPTPHNTYSSCTRGLYINHSKWLFPNTNVNFSIMDLDL